MRWTMREAVESRGVRFSTCCSRRSSKAEWQSTSCIIRLANTRTGTPSKRLGGGNEAIQVKSDMQKIVWEEDGQVKTAHGTLDRVTDDLIFWKGERGPLIVSRKQVISIK